MKTPLIKISHLTKVYKTGDLENVVLSNISLTIYKGEFVAIMGPSGSGKSTLMHILGALDLPTSGTYTLDGKDVGKLSDDELADIRNRKIGFVFQAYNLLPRTSALDNVMIPMEYAGVSEETQMSKAKSLLELVGLADRLDYPPNKLSGGQAGGSVSNSVYRLKFANGFARFPLVWNCSRSGGRGNNFN